MAILGQAGRVGFFVVLSVALLAWGYAWFNGGVDKHTYTIDVLFADASGADKDAPVTLAGVTIGKVKNIRLTEDQRADLTLEIKDRVEGRPFHIPVGSVFSIVTPILGSSGNIVVTPPVHNPDAAAIQPGASGLEGESAPDLNTAFAKANVVLSQLAETTKRSDKLIDALTKTAVSANNAISGPQARSALGNLNEASHNSVVLTAELSRALQDDNRELQNLLHQTGSGAQVALRNLDATTAQFRSLASQNRGRLNEITANLQDTTEALSGITGQINDALKNGNAPQNLGAILKNLKTASDNLALISDNFEKLSSDQGLQGDLRATLHNVRASTDQTTYLLERLNHIIGTKEPASAVLGPGGTPIIVAPGTSTSSLPAGGQPPVQVGRTLLGPTILPRLNLVQELRAHHFRSDLDAVLPIRGSAPGAFVRAGIYGLGDTNEGIFEYGAALDPNGLYDARAGLYASKLAVGADLGLGRRETLSLNAWDPNNLHLDMQGDVQFGNGFGLLLGEEDILRRTDPTIGLEYRR